MVAKLWFAKRLNFLKFLTKQKVRMAIFFFVFILFYGGLKKKQISLQPTDFFL
jgi:preprotein translocase subunit SecG